MQLPAGGPVVAEVVERSGVRVQGVGPVGFRPRSVKHHELHRVFQRAAMEPETTLIPDARQQLAQRVISAVTCRATTVDTLKDQISSAQLAELHDMWHIHQRSLSSRRSAYDRALHLKRDIQLPGEL